MTMSNFSHLVVQANFSVGSLVLRRGLKFPQLPIICIYIYKKMQLGKGHDRYCNDHQGLTHTWRVSFRGPRRKNGGFPFALLLKPPTSGTPKIDTNKQTHTHTETNVSMPKRTKSPPTGGSASGPAADEAAGGKLLQRCPEMAYVGNVWFDPCWGGV